VSDTVGGTVGEPLHLGAVGVSSWHDPVVASTSSQATEAWDALAAACLRRRADSLDVRQGPGRRGLTAVWPLSQVIAAAIDLSATTGDLTDVEGLLRSLERYRAGDGFAPTPRARTRYFDDNAWVGLCFAQLHLQTGDEAFLRSARDVLSFVRQGEHPDGGVRWVEGRDSRNTCSTAPASELALRIHLADGDPDALAFARRNLLWLDRTLLLPSGLYADRIDGTQVDTTVWSYNQGAAAGASALLHRATSEPEALRRANEIARATLERFDPPQLWRHPPVFNAISFRNLLALDATRPVTGVRRTLRDYLSRVWSEARDPKGLFTAGGIGSYDDRAVVDHAGLVQLFALEVWPPERLPDVC
jgi:Glycosyl hydrolase family 76